MQKSMVVSLAANVALAAAVIILWHERATTPAATPAAREAAASVSCAEIEVDGATADAARAPNARDESASAETVEAMDRFESKSREQFQALAKSAAIQRVREFEARASAKETYRDFVVYARLNADQERRFYDLMAKFIVDSDITGGPDFISGEPLDAPSPAERQFEAGLQALLGDAGAARYHDFQAADVVKADVSRLVEQLEGRDVPLTGEQRARLVRAVIEHRQEFVEPKLDESFMHEFMKDADVAENKLMGLANTAANLRLDRLESLAQSILNAEQMRSFEDLRSAQHARNEIITSSEK